MNKTRFALSATALFAMILVCSSLAQAQATRTWVSGVGDDANPCSRTAPCKTFAGAISKTAACGEISVLDPGGFGAVTITKSITINGDGTLAGILASLTNGIIINGANAVVNLRSLSINGACNGLNGIRFIQGSTLMVDNVSIVGFTGFGIDINRGAAAGGFVAIRNVTINNCAGGGISVTQNNASAVRVNVENTQVFGSLFGIKAGANSRVSARECHTSGMSDGFLAVPHHGVDELLGQGRVVNRIGLDLTNFRSTSSAHLYLPLLTSCPLPEPLPRRPSAAWRRTSTGSACD
jgi:hypothetical protein